MFFTRRDRRTLNERLTVMALNLANLTNVMSNLVAALQAQNQSIQALIAAHTDTAAQAQVDQLATSAQAVVDTVTASTVTINTALQQ